MNPCIVARSASGDLLACIPSEGRGARARYRVRRCPAPELNGELEELYGPISGVARANDGQHVAVAQLVDAGGIGYRRLSSPHPRRTSQLAVTLEDGRTRLLSDELVEVYYLEQDRAWAVELMLRAFRNHDRSWREFLTEKEYEHGDEGIVDDEDESMSRQALDACYRRRLAYKALARTQSARRRGLEVNPTVMVVSNEELERTLGEALLGLPGTSEPYLAATA